MALSLRKIIWGVDSPDEAGGPPSRAAEILIKDICDRTGAALQIYVVHQSSSAQQAAEMLAAHADEIFADAIVVSTHGASGVRRLLFGSFAENLILEARCPVFVVPPHLAPRAGTIREVLVPSELRVKEGFIGAVELARAFGAHLTLFHEIPHPIEPIVQSGIYLLGGGWISAQEYYTDETVRKSRRARAWARWAKRRNVEVEPIVELGGAAVAQRVFALARERHADLIAMETHTGRVSAALVGSIARNVVRAAPCPVWILGPRVEKPVLSSDPAAA